MKDGDFDIIFLDIQGVGLKYSDQEGLGILEHLKKANPGQVARCKNGPFISSLITDS